VAKIKYLDIIPTSNMDFLEENWAVLISFERSWLETVLLSHEACLATSLTDL
jgi:hypothetical protein